MKNAGLRLLTLAFMAAFSVWCAEAPRVGSAALQNLTIDQAIGIALTNHPHLAEAMAKIQTSKARAEAAGSFPNPEAVARMESAPFSSRTTSQAEYVLGLSQAIPLGGRLSAARKVEEALLAARQKERAVAGLELTRKVRGAFATALYTSEVFLAQTNLTLNIQELVRITRARVEQGDAPAADLARVEAEEAEQKLANMEATAAQHDALDALASAMGNYRTGIESLSGKLEDVLHIVDLKELSVLAPHPALEAMESAVAAEQAKVRLSRAERFPDVNLDLFYRRLQGTRENAFDVGVSVPIPSFDNGRKRVRAAEGELRAAEARLDKARDEIGRDLHIRELALQRAFQSASVLKESIIPKVETSLRASEARYSAGDISLSELLVVRREANASRLRYLAALTEVLEEWAWLARF